jgi:hypothetical protein
MGASLPETQPLLYDCNGLWRFYRGGRCRKGSDGLSRCTGGAEPEPAERVAKGRIAERSKRRFDLRDPRRIGFAFNFGWARWRRRRSHARRNLADPKDELPDLGRLQALVQRSRQPVPHHAQVMKPHGIRYMDDQATVPKRVGFGMSGDLGADDRWPDPPDLVLAHPAFDAKALQRAGQRVRDLDRMAPGLTHPMSRRSAAGSERERSGPPPRFLDWRGRRLRRSVRGERGVSQNDGNPRCAPEPWRGEIEGWDALPDSAPEAGEPAVRSRSTPRGPAPPSPSPAPTPRAGRHTPRRCSSLPRFHDGAAPPRLRPGRGKAHRRRPAPDSPARPRRCAPASPQNEARTRARKPRAAPGPRSPPGQPPGPAVPRDRPAGEALLLPVVRWPAGATIRARSQYPRGYPGK